MLVHEFQYLRCTYCFFIMWVRTHHDIEVCCNGSLAFPNPIAQQTVWHPTHVIISTSSPQKSATTDFSPLSREIIPQSWDINRQRAISHNVMATKIPKIDWNYKLRDFLLSWRSVHAVSLNTYVDPINTCIDSISVNNKPRSCQNLSQSEHQAGHLKENCRLFHEFVRHLIICHTNTQRDINLTLILCIDVAQNQTDSTNPVSAETAMTVQSLCPKWWAFSLNSVLISDTDMQSWNRFRAANMAFWTANISKLFGQQNRPNIRGNEFLFVKKQIQLLRQTYMKVLLVCQQQ